MFMHVSIYASSIHIHSNTNVIVPTCICIIVPKYVHQRTEDLMVSQLHRIEIVTKIHTILYYVKKLNIHIFSHHNVEDNVR